MKTGARCASLALLAGFLGGCAAPPGSAVGPAVAVPLTDKLGVAFCDYQSRCCAADAGDCASTARSVFAPWGDGLWARIDAGVIVVDWAAVDLCVRAVGAARCDDLTYLLALPACQGMLVGQLALGASCMSHLECPSDAACSAGICGAAGALGQACSGLLWCSGALCRVGTCRQGLACINGACGQWPVVGEACLGASGARCYASINYCGCAASLLPGCPDGGVCESTRPAGQPCTFPTQCRSLLCAQGVCGTGGTANYQCR